MSKEKEYTKVVNQKCQDCGKRVSILCNENSQIVAVLCSDCFQTFLISTIDVEQLRNYLKKNGWIETPFARKTAIRFLSPEGCVTLIPARKNLVDFVKEVKEVLTSIAIYDDKTFDGVLSEVLNTAKVSVRNIKEAK